MWGRLRPGLGPGGTIGPGSTPPPIPASQAPWGPTPALKTRVEMAAPPPRRNSGPSGVLDTAPGCQVPAPGTISYLAVGKLRHRAPQEPSAETLCDTCVPVMNHPQQPSKLDCINIYTSEEEKKIKGKKVGGGKAGGCPFWFPLHPREPISLPRDSRPSCECKARGSGNFSQLFPSRATARSQPKPQWRNPASPRTTGTARTAQVRPSTETCHHSRAPDVTLILPRSTNLRKRLAGPSLASAPRCQEICIIFGGPNPPSNTI